MSNIVRSGFKDHLAFALAVDFCYSKTKEPCKYSKNRFETIGNLLQSPIGKAVDLTIKEMNNPVAIVGASLITATAVTVMFYPDQFFYVFPLVRHIEPWMIKSAMYAVVQTSILGVGVRAYGHFTNRTIYENWLRGKIDPVQVGNKQIS